MLLTFGEEFDMIPVLGGLSAALLLMWKAKKI